MTHAERCKKYRLAHPERVKEQQRKWLLNNKEKRKQIAANWYKNNPEKSNEITRRWRKENPEKHRECLKRWKVRHPDKYKAKQKRAFDKRVSTIKGKLNHAVKNNMLQSLKNGSKAGRRWESLVNFTVDDLRVHLEKQFDLEMSWDNYGKKGWEIDHKTPLAYFHFNNPADEGFKNAWSLDNLQPLWAIDNQRKGASI